MKKILLLSVLFLAAACNQTDTSSHSNPADSSSKEKITASVSTACSQEEFTPYLPKNPQDYYEGTDSLNGSFSDPSIGIERMDIPYSNQWLNGDYNIPKYEELKQSGNKVSNVVFGKIYCPTGPGEGGYYNGNWGRFFDMEIVPHRTAEETLTSFKKESNITNDAKTLNDPALAADWEKMFKIEQIGNVTAVFGAAPYFSMGSGDSWVEVVGNKFNYRFHDNGLMPQNRNQETIRAIIKTIVLSK